MASQFFTRRTMDHYRITSFVRDRTKIYAVGEKGTIEVYHYNNEDKAKRQLRYLNNRWFCGRLDSDTPKDFIIPGNIWDHDEKKLRRLYTKINLYRKFDPDYQVECEQFMKRIKGHLQTLAEGKIPNTTSIKNGRKKRFNAPKTDPDDILDPNSGALERHIAAAAPRHSDDALNYITTDPGIAAKQPKAPPSKFDILRNKWVAKKMADPNFKTVIDPNRVKSPFEP